MWGGEGDVLCIDPATGITDSKLVTTQYNDFAHLRWLGKIDGKTPVFNTAESGRWVCVESRVKVNTPGKKDGVFNLWIDGKLEASHTDLDWHGTWDAYAINAVCIENYWNQGATKREARYFDNFVISTQPIGPIVAANPPVVTRTAVDVTGWEAQVATSPEGTDVVWGSKMLPGGQASVTVDAEERDVLRQSAGTDLARPGRDLLAAGPGAGDGGVVGLAHALPHRGEVATEGTDETDTGLGLSPGPSPPCRWADP